MVLFHGGCYNLNQADQVRIQEPQTLDYSVSVACALMGWAVHDLCIYAEIIYIYAMVLPCEYAFHDSRWGFCVKIETQGCVLHFANVSNINAGLRALQFTSTLCLYPRLESRHQLVVVTICVCRPHCNSVFAVVTCSSGF